MNRKSKKARQNTKTRRCAIYTRKSTAIGLEQEFNSLDAQREACEQYIKVRSPDGWELIPDRYDDGGFTGANLERPAFQRLLSDIELGNVDIIVVYKVDRLSRTLLDFAQVMDLFNKAGVAFVSITQNFSTADAMGRLTLNMLMSFAEFERAMIAERTRDKMAASRRKGKWTGGYTPLGYDVVDKKLVVNEFEAAVVNEIYDLYLEHRSALVVTEILNNLGRPTKRRNGDTNNRFPWNKDVVLRVLRSPISAGLITSVDELFEGEHKAIVPREKWNLVQTLLGNGTCKKRGRNPEYLLRGLIRCACCNYALSPASSSRNGKENRYYRSIVRDKKGKGICQARPIPAAAIEKYVIDRIREVTANGSFADGILHKVKARVADRRRSLDKERTLIPNAIAKLAAEGQSLTIKLSREPTPASTILDTRIEKIGEELSANENRLAEVERQLTRLAEIEIDTEWVISVLRDFDAIWEVMTPENRYRLVHALVQEVIVDEKAGSVTARLVNFESEDSISNMSLSSEQDTHVSKASRKRRLLRKPKQPSLDNEC